MHTRVKACTKTKTTPHLEGYASEVESRDRDGGEVITYIREDKKFTRLKTLKTTDEAQMIKTKIYIFICSSD